jgi:GWxTD domain-containing protein
MSTEDVPSHTSGVALRSHATHGVSPYATAVCRRRLAAGIALAVLCAGALATRSAHALTSAERHDLVVRALALDQAGRAREAVPLLRSAVWRSGDEADSLRILLARVLFHVNTIETRAEAAALYKAVLRRHPDDIALRREYGVIQERRGFRMEAREAYEEILKRQPQDSGAALHVARYNIAYWKRSLSDEALKRALETTRRAAAPDTAQTAKLLLAMLLCESGAIREARTTLDAVARDGARDPRVDLLRGSCALRLKRPAEAESLFLLGLARLPASTRHAYDDVRTFSDSAHAAAERLRFPGSDSLFVEAQWRMHDPTYATRINERRLEQWDRMLWSDLLFGDPERHIDGWATDPGIAWVRYGRPRRWDYWLFPARWEWTYQVDRDLRTVRFFDRFLNGGFGIEWPDPNVPLGETEEILANTLSGRIEIFVEPPGQVIPLEIDGSLLYADGVRPWASVVTGIPAPFDTTNMSPKKRRKLPALSLGPFERTVTLYDMLWRERGLVVDTLDTARRWPARWGIALSADSVAMPFGRYYIAVTLHDLTTNAHGDGLLQIDVPAHAPTEMTLSNIMLAWWAGSESGLRGARISSGLVSRPGGIAVLPNPIDRYAADEHVYVYYEIYRSQKDQRSEIPVLVTYTITRARQRRPLFGHTPVTSVSNTVREVVRRPVDGHVLDIDIDRLDPGPYTLLLTVTDAGTGDTASSSTLFEKANLAGQERWGLEKHVEQ